MAQSKTRKPKEAPKAQKACGLCGKLTKLVRTECCGQWACDDENNQVLFSCAQTSCYRNHRRYTLCGSHFAEGHEGPRQTCEPCRGESRTEMYVWHGTNDCNFETLQNPPAFGLTLCGYRLLAPPQALPC